MTPVVCFQSLSSVKRYWFLVNTVYVNIGGLSAGVYILQRTQEVFQALNKSENGPDDQASTVVEQDGHS